MIIDLILCMHIAWSCMFIKTVPTHYRLLCWQAGEQKPSIKREHTEMELAIMLEDMKTAKDVMCYEVSDKSGGKPVSYKKECEEKYLDEFLHKAEVCEKVNLTPKEKDFCYSQVQKSYKEKIEECRVNKKQKWRV